MDLSMVDVIELVKDALSDSDISSTELEAICNDFKENDMDGSALAATIDNINALFIAFPTIKKGFLFKIYSAFLSTVKLRRKSSDCSTISEASTQSTSFSEASTELASEECCSSKSCTVSRANESPEEVNSSNEEDEMVLDDLSVPNLKKPIPKQFPIERCNFGYNAKEVIRSGKITSAGKREITSELIQVMKRYESKPTPSLRSKAAQALVLQGKAALGMDVLSAKRFWQGKITQKLNTYAKKERKKLGVATTSKHAANNKKGVAVTAIVQRRKVSSSELNDRFNEEEMEEAKQILIEEFKKPSSLRNKKVINDQMALSFRYRRNEVLTQSPNSKTFLKEWPAIAVYDEIIREFKRLQSISMEEIGNNAKSLFSKIISMVERNTKKSSRECALLAKLPSSDEQFADIHVIIGVLLLCCQLKSNTKRDCDLSKYLFDISPENTTLQEIAQSIKDRYQPFVVAYGDAAVAKNFTVFVELHPVVTTADALQSLVSVLALYYIFNMEYSKHACKVLQFLQQYLLGIKEEHPFNAVQELAMQLGLNP